VFRYQGAPHRAARVVGRVQVGEVIETPLVFWTLLLVRPAASIRQRVIRVVVGILIFFGSRRDHHGDTTDTAHGAGLGNAREEFRSRDPLGSLVALSGSRRPICARVWIRNLGCRNDSPDAWCAGIGNRVAVVVATLRFLTRTTGSLRGHINPFRCRFND